MIKDIKYDFNDILIKPKTTTNISTREDIDVSDNDGMYPLFAAPMDTVINEDNEGLFEKLGVNVCMPRGENGGADTFISYSLKEFSYMITNKSLPTKSGRYLIDIANGHMGELLEATKEAKKKYPDITLMVGNIANPDTYRELSNAGADYIRVGIGNGGGCLTTQNTGVGYPMASLIRECYYQSLAVDEPAKIVADGGMKDYSDIIKALAIGADYVMVGSIFNKALESAGECYEKIGDNFHQMTQNAAGVRLGHGYYSVYKKFRGMSTKEVQKKWGVEFPKTSEGVVKYQEVEYTLSGWLENFEHYLKSAMSYTGCKNLEEFRGNVDLINITEQAYKRFNK
jgi:IMP dehydrogenase/GMP reductase